MNTESNQSEVRTWALLLHLSVFTSYVIPLAGIIAPVVIWQIKKDEMPEIDAHGKIVTNGVISFTIYFFVSILLTFVLIGIPLLIVVGICAIVFPIIGGIKAHNGELWPYPLTIQFFK